MFNLSTRRDRAYIKLKMNVLRALIRRVVPLKGVVILFVILKESSGCNYKNIIPP